jgi:hypothetical protein
MTLVTRSICLWVSLAWVSIGQATSDPQADPHGDPNACSACHAPAPAMRSGRRDAPSSRPVGETLPIIATCLGCHADADMHPVGMAPDEVKVNDWPLEDGLMTCATCHVEPSHDGLSQAKPPYHRGGPYPRTTDFCYSCHEADAYKRADPHHPTTPRGTDDGSCSACHSGKPETGASPEQSHLRTAASGQCRTCHEDEVHTGVATHVDHRLDEAAIARLPVEVPVAEDGKVQCWSCHEVHRDRPTDPAHKGGPLRTDLQSAAEAGPWSELGPYTWPNGTVDRRHDPMLALGAADLCQSCHGVGP